MPTEEEHWTEALRHVARLRAYIRNRLRDSSAIDDVVQEVYTRFTPVDKTNIRSFEAFLVRIARNLLSNGVRRKRSDPIVTSDHLEPLEIPDTAPTPERSAAAQQELEQLVAYAANQLTERQRQVFVLFNVYGFTAREIAAHLTIAESTVRAHLKQAMGSIRRFTSEDREPNGDLP